MKASEITEHREVTRQMSGGERNKQPGPDDPITAAALLGRTNWVLAHVLTELVEQGKATPREVRELLERFEDEKKRKSHLPRQDGGRKW